MRGNAIEWLLEGRMIAEITADDDEIVALWRKAVRSYGDSETPRISRDGAFKLLYDAGRQAATAFIGAHGYRAKGTAGHHHSVFAAAAALAAGEHADLFRRMDLQRGRRHEVEYSAVGELEPQEIEEIRALVLSLMNETAAALRKVRPAVSNRFRKVR